jgi:Putative peptidoglycan binding domain
MKSTIVFVLSASFLVTSAIAAENASQNGSTTSHSAAPAAKNNVAPAHVASGVRNPAGVAGKPRLGSVPNLPRNYPIAFESIQRGPLAVNTARPVRNYQPRPSSELSLPAQRAHVGGSKFVNNATKNPQVANNNRSSYADALKRCRHERHDCNWWRRHCRTIVFVNTGYYYLDSGYWYPAYGYDAAYDYYDTDGPIYTYGNLLPDQVIANVQTALREAGYYVGAITGSLGPGTRAALANFQRDYGLVITGAVDEPTVQTLGLM